MPRLRIIQILKVDLVRQLRQINLQIEQLPLVQTVLWFGLRWLFLRQVKTTILLCNSVVRSEWEKFWVIAFVEWAVALFLVYHQFDLDNWLVGIDGWRLIAGNVKLALPVFDIGWAWLAQGYFVWMITRILVFRTLFRLLSKRVEPSVDYLWVIRRAFVIQYHDLRLLVLVRSVLLFVFGMRNCVIELHFGYLVDALIR